MGGRQWRVAAREHGVSMWRMKKSLELESGARSINL